MTLDTRWLPYQITKLFSRTQTQFTKKANKPKDANLSAFSLVKKSVFKLTVVHISSSTSSITCSKSEPICLKPILMTR